MGLSALLNIVRVIEAIDGLPGAGQLLRGAVNGFYFATAAAAALVRALVSAVANLLAELAHGRIDPCLQHTKNPAPTRPRSGRGPRLTLR